MGLTIEQDVVVDVFVKEVGVFLKNHPNFEGDDCFFSEWPCPEKDVMKEIYYRCLEVHGIHVRIEVSAMNQMRSFVVVSETALEA